MSQPVPSISPKLFVLWKYKILGIWKSNPDEEFDDNTSYIIYVY